MEMVECTVLNGTGFRRMSSPREGLVQTGSKSAAIEAMLPILVSTILRNLYFKLAIYGRYLD